MAQTESACSVVRIYTCGTAATCLTVDDTLNRVSIASDSGSETRVTVDNFSRTNQGGGSDGGGVLFEDVYQDQLHPFVDALFKGYSTVVFNLGAKDERLRCLHNTEQENPGLVNLAAEQVFTTVKSASGGTVEFLVHVSIFDVQKDKVGGWAGTKSANHCCLGLA